MPKKNGIEATACIGSLSETVVIGLSVQAGEEARRAILNAGGAVDEGSRSRRALPHNTEVLDAQPAMAAVKALPRSAESDTRRARSVSCSVCASQPRTVRLCGGSSSKGEGADVGNSQMADEIRNRQDLILKHWMDYQLSALTLRRDRVKESELEMSRQFLDVLKRSRRDSDASSPSWKLVKEHV